ncbi:hypothetical protein BKA59DRAFT_544808 [Fusarium tricinctum]|uniref:CBM-cenC domain-containing protein n=1 Tax=Fusarium tricinctum TaxID=61284 RepID=A0A8K0RWG6_9HYPO|nr:hypothetical protein BKA59DRAFT_544808 [Fusarium tricinctum]
MRWSSFATVLSAALLPAASARALCRPDRSTATTASTIVEKATTFETLSTDAATIATSIESSATVEITDGSDTTGASDTTLAETETAIVTDITTVMTSTATEAPSTTEASTTVSEAPVITDFVIDGSFEDRLNPDWTLQSATVQNHNTQAHRGSRYAEFRLDNEIAEGSKRVTQAVARLNTERTYRLAAFANVFSTPMPVKGGSDKCVIEVAQSTPSFEMRLAQWVLNFEILERYTEYSVDFSPLSTDISLLFKLRCTIGAQITLATGLDDISLVDIGPKLVG